MRSLGNKLQIFERRIAVRFSISTDGTGRIPITTLASSASVSGLADFTLLAGLYLAYRVKAMKATWSPVFAANVAGIAPSPALLASASFTSGLAPTTYAQTLDSSSLKLHSGYAERSTAVIDWNGQLDAKLWTPTNAAVAAAESYGVFVVSDSSATVSQLSTLYFCGVAEYAVEFMSAA